MLSGLALAMCIYPNPVPFVSDEPFEAIWKAAAVSAVVLGVQTLVLARFGPGASMRRLAMIAGVACAVMVVVAVVAGRFAVRGLVCEAVPFPSPLPPDVQAALAARSQQDVTTLYVLGTLTLLSWAAAWWSHCSASSACWAGGRGRESMRHGRPRTGQAADGGAL